MRKIKTIPPDPVTTSPVLTPPDPAGDRKWTVCVYGQLPDQIDIVAKDRETAEEAALQIILEGIEFHGHLAE